MAEGIPDVVSFGLGEPDFDTPQHIKEAAVDALRNGYTHYTSNYGLSELREAISRKLKRDNNIDADPRSEVIVTSGAQEALFSVIQTYIDPGDEVLVTDPCYDAYRQMIRLAGGIPVYVKLNEDFRLNANKLESKVSSRAKLLIINSPHNPTGSVFTRDDLKRIAEIAVRHNLLVASDEAYEKILYDNLDHVSIASLPGMEDRTITVQSFSKTCAMTGWRIGYCAADKKLVDEIIKVHAHCVGCANAVAQKAAVAALEGPQHCVQEMVQEFARRRDFVMKRLSEIETVNCVVPRGAFYVFPRILKTAKSSTELAEYLLKEARIITAPGSEYGPESDQHLRLSFATSIENLQVGLDRFEKGLAKTAH
jgi:aspartate/methionine/tyrosine aminotransferase